MKAAIFDLGHTLIDYPGDWRGPERKAIQQLYQLARQNGTGAEEDAFVDHASKVFLENRDKKLRNMTEVPLQDLLGPILQHFGVEVDDDLLWQGFDIFYGVLAEERLLLPGSKEVLERFKDKGYAVGLISDVAWGLPSDYPLKDMKEYRIHDYFDDLMFSTDVGLRKPHPRLFKLSMKNLGVSVDDCFYVGNSVRADIQGALGVGMRAFLKESRHQEPVDGVVPTAKIEEWNDLCRILIGMR